MKINKELAQFASRKQLTEALTAFENAHTLKLANYYTYVNMLNVCVRCADLDRAVSIFSSMKLEAKLSPDVVAYTTLLKGLFATLVLYIYLTRFVGLCGEGRLQEALKYVSQMEKSHVDLNVRTVNTLLRGCILVGGVAEADSIFASLGKWKVTPDASTWEYMVALYCRNLQLKKALSLFGRGILSCADQVGSNSSILLNLARAATLLGDRATAFKYIEMTHVSLKKEHSLPPTDNEQGGKRGWGAAADTESRKESLAVFLRIKHDELKRELTVIESYFNEENAALDAVALYEKVFLVPLVQPKKTSLSASLAAGVLDTMGLRALLKKNDTAIAALPEKFESKLKAKQVIRMRKVWYPD